MRNKHTDKNTHAQSFGKSIEKSDTVLEQILVGQEAVLEGA